ncbi:MAG: DNA cytosine methyltransferase [Oscillospiraceae bacterium]|jgi:DNA (cytosine-5)-methyltransferase 1|nr:DNA cytosine methyltransferase [Oscillospiraceae bacterium]
MITVNDVANQLKVSAQHIRSLLRKGYIKAEMVGKQWIIQQNAVDQYIKDFCISIEPDDHPRKTKELPDIVALSFFTGAMGLDIGMEKGGITALLACEFDKACRLTIDRNRPEMALIGDINNYSATEILRFAGIPKKRKVDVIFGGPPCQAFSSAGSRKGFEDSRGNVFLKYIDIVTEIMPTYIVIENVRGLLSSAYPYSDNDVITDEKIPIKGGALLHILKVLREAGYTVAFELYNAANYGAPQIRERVIMIAYHGSEKVPYLSPSHSNNEIYGLPNWRTLSEALDILPKNTVHQHVAFPEVRLKYYRMLKEGQYWKHLSPDMQKEAMGHSYNLGGGKTGFFRRVSFNRPSPTLVTHPAMPATDLCHPKEDRPLSVQEYKAIQEFPASWEICGSILDQYKQIGNAVPIALGEAIAKTITAHMSSIKQEEYLGFPYSRYKYTNDESWEKQTRKQIKSSDEVHQLSLFSI